MLLVRETPLHLGHLRLLVQVAELGAVVLPPVPAFYHRPATLKEVIDQTVNRVLDLLDIEIDQDLFPRWQGPAEQTPRQPVNGQARAFVRAPRPGRSAATIVNWQARPEEQERSRELF